LKKQLTHSLGGPPPGGNGPYTASNGGLLPETAAWSWGGCADETEFAYSKSKEFIDVGRNSRRRGDLSEMLQSHNYEAGRLVSFNQSKLTALR